MTAPPVVAFTLPLPPSALLANETLGRDWRAFVEAKQAYYQSCFVDCQNARLAFQKKGVGFPLKPLVTMVLVFVLPDMRRKDGDGLVSALKSGIDAMVKAGLLHDDSIWELRGCYEGRLAAKGEKGCVEVRLEGGA